MSDRIALANVIEVVLEAGVKVGTPDYIHIKQAFNAEQWREIVSALRSRTDARTDADPFNCPKCGRHDYGLYASQICPWCLVKERDELRINLAAVNMHLNAAYKAAGLSENSSEPLSSVIARMVNELTHLSTHHDRLTEISCLIDQLEVYGQPDWPCGVSFAITGLPGRYESARAAIDAAIAADAGAMRDVQFDQLARAQEIRTLAENLPYFEELDLTEVKVRSNAIKRLREATVALVQEMLKAQSTVRP